MNLKKYVEYSIFSDDVECADPHAADLWILFSHTTYHPNYLLILSRGMGSNDRVVYKMRHEDVQVLYQAIDEDWDDWVSRAVESDNCGWNNSHFLLENVPIMIAVRYGQNQKICHGNDMNLEQEATHWHHIHDYRHMRQITFALATHVQ